MTVFVLGAWISPGAATKLAALRSHAVVLTKYEAVLPKAIREDAARKNRCALK